MVIASGRRVRVELAAEPRSAQLARRLVGGALHGWRLGQLEETAALLVSELATNAVLHARTDFLVEAEHRDGLVRVSVFDCSAAGPARRHSSLQASTGRGIGLVETLASAWGTGAAVRPWSKVVWFELSTDPDALPEPADGALLERWPT